MALLYLPQFKTTQLSGAIDSSQTSSITLLNVDGVDTSKPGIICVTYATPLDTSVAEFISYTSINGSKVLVGATRGEEGISAKAHLDQAQVGFVISKSHINNINDLLTGVTAGISVKTGLYDTNNNESILLPATASAVNEVTITNAATGNAPSISATGGDTNIDLQLSAKGTGKILQDAHYQTPQTYTPEAAGTATLDLSTGNEHRITMPEGDITIAISNETDGQKFIVSILQDGTGSRTVTWFSTIKWAGGSAPTLTTTADKRDVFGFIVTGTDTYDGFVIGQSI